MKKKFSKYFWVKQLRDLERYCNEIGYRVVCKPVDIEFVQYESKLITLSNKKNDELTLYYLLHEMGHIALMENGEKYKKSYGFVFDNFCISSITHRIAILEEELDAWKEGLILSNTLGLYINRRKWEMQKSKCISSYVSWIEDKKTKHNKPKETKANTNE